MEEVNDMLTIRAVDPKLVGTRSLMVEDDWKHHPMISSSNMRFLETSLCYLIINQPENCAQADQAPATSTPRTVFKTLPKSHWGV